MCNFIINHPADADGPVQVLWVSVVMGVIMGIQVMVMGGTLVRRTLVMRVGSKVYLE